MQPNKYVHGITHSYFSVKNLYITHNQFDDKHVVSKHTENCHEEYSITGKDAFEKAQKAFNKWVAVGVK
jgi:hypothetical protein